MSLVFINDEDTRELIMSLPSINIRRYASVLGVYHPNGNDIIVLKTRFNKVMTEEIKEKDFEIYSDTKPWGYDYSEMVSKFIIIDRKLLNKRRSERIFDKYQ
ncbi:hypothetical protein J2W97_001218 [Paenibacillus jamilae]|nr:hypothetical protein [Paenibacillus jamilae]